MELNLNKKTQFGWSWTNNGYNNLAIPPEFTGTIGILAKISPWDDPSYRASNYDSTASSFFIFINKRWYSISSDEFWLIKNYGVSRIKIDIYGDDVSIVDMDTIELELYSRGY